MKPTLLFNKALKALDKEFKPSHLGFLRDKGHWAIFMVSEKFDGLTFSQKFKKAYDVLKRIPGWEEHLITLELFSEKEAHNGLERRMVIPDDECRCPLCVRINPLLRGNG